MAKDGLIFRFEQVVAPGDGVAHRAQAVGQVAGTVHQEGQCEAEPLQQRGRGEDVQPRRRQLEGEGETVQATADAGHGGDVLRRAQGVDTRFVPPLHEQVDRGVGESGDAIEDRIRLRDGQGRDRDDVLAAQPQPGAAGDQRLEAGAGAQQIGQVCARGENLLEVVQDQQHLAVAQRGLQGRQRWLTARVAQAECGGDGGHDQIGIGDGRQPHQAHPVGERIRHRRADGQGEARLANTAGTGQRHQAYGVAPQQVPHGRDVTVPADEGREWRWQRCGRRQGRLVRSRGCLRILGMGTRFTRHGMPRDEL